MRGYKVFKLPEELGPLNDRRVPKSASGFASAAENYNALRAHKHYPQNLGDRGSCAFSLWGGGSITFYARSRDAELMGYNAWYFTHAIAPPPNYAIRKRAQEKTRGP